MYVSAKIIFPVTSSPIKNGVLKLDSNGKILDIFQFDKEKHNSLDIHFFEGVIVPGFVNTHCHLELSDMKDKIPAGGGLIKFLTSVASLRKTLTREPKKNAIADQKMYENGISAVGDISNTADTAQIKGKSKIYYHTFVEVMGINQEDIEKKYSQRLELSEHFENKSLVPHAHYTVLPSLFKEIAQISKAKDIISIHNQETQGEDEFSKTKSGEILDVYKFLQKEITEFEASRKSSLQTYLPNFSKEQNILLVHNVFTSIEDIVFAENFSRNIYWCLCPNSNLYIQNILPKVENFVEKKCKITIGTDSLSSNYKLDMIAEMLTLQNNFPSLSFEQILTWATQNGAKALQISDRFGSIEIGKTPGIVLIKNFDYQNIRLTNESKAERVIIDKLFC